MRLTSLIVGIMLILSFEASAEFFKYKDSNGAIVITDKLENVPKQYRNQLKVIWNEDLEKKDPLARRWAAAKAIQDQKDHEQKQKQEAEKKNADSKKQVVISIDEETGKIIRTLE